jgi:hypothetical protein
MRILSYSAAKGNYYLPKVILYSGISFLFGVALGFQFGVDAVRKFLRYAQITPQLVSILLPPKYCSFFFSGNR